MWRAVPLGTSLSLSACWHSIKTLCPYRRSLGSWGMNPIVVLRFLPVSSCGSNAAIRTCPDERVEIPAIDLSNELFPAPFLPMIATISCVETFALIALRALCSP